MGQDDSAVNGKHLPPSPRRQASSRSLPNHPPLHNNLPTEESSDHPLRNSLPDVPAIQLSEPSETACSPTLEESTCNVQLTPDCRRPAARSLSRQKVLSKKKPQQDQSQPRTAGPGGGQPSALVPWEMEKGKSAGDVREVKQEEVQEKGLLEEIESMCRLSMAITSNLEFTRVQKNTSSDES